MSSPDMAPLETLSSHNHKVNPVQQWILVGKCLLVTGGPFHCKLCKSAQVKSFCIENCITCSTCQVYQQLHICCRSLDEQHPSASPIDLCPTGVTDPVLPLCLSSQWPPKSFGEYYVLILNLCLTETLAHTPTE